MGRHPNGVLVVSIVGELDTTTLPEVRLALDPEIDKSPTTVIFDLRHLRFLHTGALRLFVDYRHKLAEAGGRLMLVNVPPRVIRLLEILGLDRTIAIHEAEGPTGWDAAREAELDDSGPHRAARLQGEASEASPTSTV